MATVATSNPLAPTVTAPPNPRVYNAIYSSVQVYECMVRGIAVMRRRLDSYVNATQILKVAGIDKGRRTKILEKEILPGRHEIVQGGYGKYQGTWIPLERGREVATQFGVLPLLAPLFDYVPIPSSVGNLPSMRPVVAPHAIYGFQHPAFPQHYSAIGPPYAPPGTAMSMLQQGRAHGLFTPTQSALPPPGASHLYHNQHYPSQVPHPQPHSGTTPGTSSSVASSSKGPPSVSSANNSNAPHGPPTSIARTSSQTSSVGAPAPPVAGAKRPRPSDTSLSRTMSQNSKETFNGREKSSDSRVELQPSQPVPTGSTLARADSSTSTPPMPSEPRATKRARLTPAPPSPPDIIQPTPLSSTTPAVSVDGSSKTSQGQSAPVAPIPQPNSVSALPNLQPPLYSQSGLPPLPRSVPKHLLDPPETKSRFSSKPSASSRISDGDKQAPLKNASTQAILLAMFQDDNPATVIEMLTVASPQDGPIDVDMILDDQGHTALHWAVALARVPCAEMLVTSGADVHRGNFAGETPLMRAVLATNNHENQSFGDVLTLLMPTLRTVDSSSRSVLHHISHVAGVKGRAASARYYMETVLERLVRQKKELGDFADLVDLQDIHGDTAINISARVGNRALVRMLMDVGANKILANKLGLRPGDFGVEGENLKAPQAEDILSVLRKGPSPPVQKSQDVIADMTAMIQALSGDFQAEIKVKQDSLDVTQAHLRAATRELAEQRRQIQHWQTELGKLDQIQQRILNVERVLKEEDSFDWTGRTEADGSPADTSARGGVPKMFEYRGPGSTMIGFGSGKSPLAMTLTDVDPAMPYGTGGDTPATWIRLKRMKGWYSRQEDLMSRRIEGAKGASAEKEFQCRKVVSLCTDVPIDMVDGMLENLIIAMESDGQVVDLGRVAGFMQKVSEGTSY